jgi:hypothetical protein
MKHDLPAEDSARLSTSCVAVAAIGSLSVSRSIVAKNHHHQAAGAPYSVVELPAKQQIQYSLAYKNLFSKV